MNIGAASELLYTWFGSNDSFELCRDFSELVPQSTDKEADKATLILSLNHLVSLNLIAKSEPINDRVYWILIKPFSSYIQTVTISPLTASRIAKLVNDAITKSDSNISKCNPTQVVESDIHNLILLYLTAMEQLNSLSKED